MSSPPSAAQPSYLNEGRNSPLSSHLNLPRPSSLLSISVDKNPRAAAPTRPSARRGRQTVRNRRFHPDVIGNREVYYCICSSALFGSTCHFSPLFSFFVSALDFKLSRFVSLFSNYLPRFGCPFVYGSFNCTAPVLHQKPPTERCRDASTRNESQVVRRRLPPLPSHYIKPISAVGPESPRRRRSPWRRWWWGGANSCTGSIYPPLNLLFMEGGGRRGKLGQLPFPSPSPSFFSKQGKKKDEEAKMPNFFPFGISCRHHGGDDSQEAGLKKFFLPQNG